MKGWIKVDRSIFACRIWTERRRYSHFEAWLDIQRRAMVYGEENGLKAGEVVLVIRKTADEWGWGIRQVHQFIHELIDEGVISQTRRESVYRIRGNKKGNKKGNAESGMDKGESEDKGNTKGNKKGNWLPYNIKEEKITKRAREDESVAPDASTGIESLDRFRAWAKNDVPELSDVSYDDFLKMRVLARGDARKLADVLLGIKADGLMGQYMMELERRMI